MERIVRHYLRNIGAVIMASLLALGSAGAGQAQSPPLWHKLEPGAHAVGFKSYWHLDYSRRYNKTFDDGTTYATGKAPRPILVNVWYPAQHNGDGKRMPHGDYLKIQSEHPQLKRFSAVLAEYNHAVIARE